MPLCSIFQRTAPFLPLRARVTVPYFFAVWSSFTETARSPMRARPWGVGITVCALVARDARLASSASGWRAPPEAAIPRRTSSFRGASSEASSGATSLILPREVKAFPSAASMLDSGWGSLTGCAASFDKASGGASVSSSSRGASSWMVAVAPQHWAGGGAPYLSRAKLLGMVKSLARARAVTSCEGDRGFVMGRVKRPGVAVFGSLCT